MLYKTRVDRRLRPAAVPAAATAMALSAATLVSLAALHLLSPQFDPSWRMVSEYAPGRYGWVLSLMFACWAASSWALAAALRPLLRTRRGRAGLAFLVLAGAGEALASAFDITHSVAHGVAGLLGVGCLPVAAMLIGLAVPAGRQQADARRPLLGLAALTWLAVAALVVTLVVMTVQVAHAYGGHLPQVAPTTLPPGVLHLDGWADRLIVVANCLWVAAAARYATSLARHSDGPPQVVAVAGPATSLPR